LSPANKNIPYELLTKTKSNISYFIDFGCKLYVFRKGTRLSKFENKYDEGFLLRYSTSSKAYKVFNKTHGIVEGVHDVCLMNQMALKMKITIYKTLRYFTSSKAYRATKPMV
jgi:hypothetical protein